MAEYLFTGSYPRVMFGLSQAVNAWHHPADGNPSELVEGQTIVLEPGDRVRVDAGFVHAELAIIPEPTPAPVGDFEPLHQEEPTPAPTTKPARNGAKA